MESVAADAGRVKRIDGAPALRHAAPGISVPVVNL